MAEISNEILRDIMTGYTLKIRFAIIVIEYFFVKFMSGGQYNIGIGDPSNHVGNLIYIGHLIFFLVLLAAGIVLTNAYWSDRENIERKLSLYVLPKWLIVLNFSVLILWTIVLYINMQYYNGVINPHVTWAIILSILFKTALFVTIPLIIAPLDTWIKLFGIYFSLPVKLLLVLILTIMPNDAPVSMYVGSHLLMPTITIAQFLYKLSGKEFYISSFDDEGYPVISEQSFSVVVRPGCSGYQGITLILLFLVLFAPFLAKVYTRSQVLMIGLLCLGVTFFMNSVRIALMVYIGENVSNKIAVNGFHTHFGIFTFMMIVSICMGFVAKKKVYFYDNGTSVNKLSQPISSGDHEFVLMLPLVTILATSIIVGIFEDDFNWLYPVPILFGALAIIPIKDKIRFDWMDVRLLPVVMGFLIFFIWNAIVPINKEYEQQFASNLYKYGNLPAISWLCLRVIGSSIFIPLAEELVFRGVLWDYIGNVLQNRFSDRVKKSIVWIGTSVIFGFLHSDIIAAIIAGIGYGGLRLLGYGVYGAIIAHIITNSIISFYAIVYSVWSFW